MYILSLDPSFRNTGWVVVCTQPDGTFVVVDAGVIMTEKEKKVRVYAGVDNHRCSQTIAKGLIELIEGYQPSLICAEAQSGSKSSKAAQLMGMCWGVVSAISAAYDIPVLQAQPTAVKKANVGKKDATKKEIEESVVAKHPNMIALLSEVKPKSKHEHAYDALSVFIACEASAEVEAVQNRRKMK